MASQIPPDWNLTLDQLVEATARGRQSKCTWRDEVRWATDYERSLIPIHARYPAAGDIYVCEEDTKVEVTCFFRRGNYPDQQSAYGWILKGERIWVFGVDPTIEPRPLSVGVNIESTDGFAHRSIPAEVRSQPDFDGFAIVVRTIQLLRSFRLERSNGTA